MFSRQQILILFLRPTPNKFFPVLTFQEDFCLHLQLCCYCSGGSVVNVLPLISQLTQKPLRGWAKIALRQKGGEKDKRLKVQEKQNGPTDSRFTYTESLYLGVLRPPMTPCPCFSNLFLWHMPHLSLEVIPSVHVRIYIMHQSQGSSQASQTQSLAALQNSMLVTSVQRVEMTPANKHSPECPGQPDSNMHLASSTPIKHIQATCRGHSEPSQNLKKEGSN